MLGTVKHVARSTVIAAALGASPLAAQEASQAATVAPAAQPPAQPPASAAGQPAAPPRPAVQARPAAPAQPPGSAPVAAPVSPSDGFDLGAALRQGDRALSADQAAELAVKSSPSVAAAVAQSQRTRLAADEAFVAVYPRLDLEARYTRLSDVDTAQFDVPDFSALADALGLDPGAVDLGDSSSSAFDDFSDPLLDQLLLQATLSYPVSDLFFKILPSYRAANRAADADALGANVEEQNVALAAREAFYNYARAKAALWIARSGLVQSEAHRRDVTTLVEAGALARVERMRADAGVASAQVAVARAEGALAVARTALSSLLHVDSEPEFAIDEDMRRPSATQSDDKQALIALALHNRSELKALDLLTEVHRTTADVHSVDAWPKLVVGGSAEYARPNQRAFGLSRQWEESWALFASVRWSPNDLAAGSTREDQARAEAMRVAADRRALEDALRVEVTRAYEDHRAARAAMEAALTGIAAAEESYRVRREQFRAGAAVATEIVDAEAELRRARLELVNAAIDLRIAAARLDRAVER